MKRIIFSFLLIAISSLSYSAVVDKILATVNGEPVTLSELERLLQPVYKQYEQIYKGDELEQYKADARDQLLEQLIENKLILQKAKKDGIEIKESAMEEELADIRDKFGSMDDFKAALEKEGMTLEQYKKDLAEQLTIKAMIERELVNKAKVRPEEIESYYNGSKGEFIRPELVRLGHILIKGDRKDREQLIQDIYKQLTEGKDFSQLAEKYSDAEDLGFIPVDQLKPELKELVESLKVGEYSKIIKTDIGWHIIRIVDKKPPETITLSAAWDDIENKIFMKKLNREHKKWVEILRQKAHIEVYK